MMTGTEVKEWLSAIVCQTRFQFSAKAAIRLY